MTPLTSGVSTCGRFDLEGAMGRMVDANVPSVGEMGVAPRAR